MSSVEKIFSENDIKTIIDEYINGCTVTEIAKTNKVAIGKISKILKDNGFVFGTGSRRFNKNKNINAFSDFSEELQAYLYGFILGDGCLSVVGNKKSVVIGLNPKDVEILEMLKKYLGVNNTIGNNSFFLKATGKTYAGVHFSFHDLKIIERLEEQGLRPRKSGRELLPNLILRESRHFWRGLIDADGCLSFANNCPSISLVGSSEITEGFSEFIKNTLGDEMKLSKHGTANAFYSSATGDRARRIVNFLYDDSKYHLNRKKVISEEIIDTIYTSKFKYSVAQPLPRKDGTFSMQIQDGKRTKRLGVFITKEEAIDARDKFLLDVNASIIKGLNVNYSNSKY